MLLRGCEAAWCWQGLPGAHPLVGRVVGGQLQEGPERGRNQAGLLPAREDVHELRQRPELPACIPEEYMPPSLISSCDPGD